MNINPVLLSFIIVFLCGCTERTGADSSIPGPDSTYRSIGVVVPRHYDVWIDKFYIESLSKNVGWRRNFGSVGCCWKSMPLAGAEWQATPEVFLINWFSFAEQQSYEALIKLKNPDGIVEKMKEPAPFESFGKLAVRPRDTLALGLAPGGTVVIWIMNRGENAIEVGRYKASRVETHPEYYREITERYFRDHGDYIREHGIKTEGW